MNQVEVEEEFEEEFEEDENYFDAEEESLYPTGMFPEVNEIRVSEIPDLKQFQYRLITGHSARKGTRGERHWRLKAKARRRQSREPRNSRYTSGSFEILNKVIGTRGQGVRVWCPRELTTEHLTEASLRLEEPLRGFWASG